jgi:adenylosuccinate synthase
MEQTAAAVGPGVCVILGAQWGDEGKGKIVDCLSSKFDYCCRFNGGSNAGHTLWVEGKRYAFHLLPSGLLHSSVTGVIGNGVVVHLPTLFTEIEDLNKNGVSIDGRLLISDRAHIVLDVHMQVDGLQEGARAQGSKIGTTKKGIGPTYADKAARCGIRMADLLKYESHFVPRYRALVDAYRSRFPGLAVDVEAEIARYRDIAKRVSPFIIDTVPFLNQAIAKGKRLMAEGANAALLDIDFGTYPYVTSSHAVAGGVPCGLGLAPSRIGTVIGVIKAYTTRVGEGPFPTELPWETNPVGKHLQQVGHEVGTTTGRPRRCGWLDLVLLQYTHWINGYTSVNLTKLDVLTGLNPLRIGVVYKLHGQVLQSVPACAEDMAAVEVVYEEMPGWTEDISTCRKFQDLPAAAQAYVNRIHSFLGCPIHWIGVGVGRNDTIEI